MRGERANATTTAAADDHQPGIDIGRRCPRRHGDRLGDTRGDIGRRNNLSARAAHLRREAKPARLDEFHLVAARGEAGKAVVAVGIRRRGRQHGRARGVQQFHRDAGFRQFPGAVNPIGIQIQPGRPADRRRRHRTSLETLLKPADFHPGRDRRVGGNRQGQLHIDLQRRIRATQHKVARAERRHGGRRLVNRRGADNHAVAGRRFNHLRAVVGPTRQIIDGERLLPPGDRHRRAVGRHRVGEVHRHRRAGGETTRVEPAPRHTIKPGITGDRRQGFPRGRARGRQGSRQEGFNRVGAEIRRCRSNRGNGINLGNDHRRNRQRRISQPGIGISGRLRRHGSSLELGNLYERLDEPKNLQSQQRHSAILSLSRLSPRRPAQARKPPSKASPKNSGSGTRET